MPNLIKKSWTDSIWGAENTPTEFQDGEFVKTSSLHPNFDAIFFQSSLHEYMKEIVFTVGFKVELNKEKLPKIENLTEKLEKIFV